MSFVLKPWQLWVVAMAGWINQQQQEVIEYLRTENQVLKETHGKKRIILNDDHRHRILVVDRQTKEIIWQYGVTDQAGHLPGFLFYPDGMDIDVFRDWKSALKR